MGSPSYINDILNKLYKEIYLKISNETIHCFLCGAKKDNGAVVSSREVLKAKLEEKELMKVIYAEDLFTNLVYGKSKNDYLSLENILAEDSDLVIIILESPGSFVEFGAFVNKAGLREKIITLMDIKYKDDESFLNLGPIKYIKSIRNKSVVYFDNITEEGTINKLKDSVKDYYKRDLGLPHTNSLTSILTLYYFLQIYLGIFSPITFKEILTHIKYISNNEEPDLDDRVASALHLMYKENIVVRTESAEKFYTLTENGYELMKEIILKNKLNLTDKHLMDKLRLSVLNSKLRYQYDLYKSYYN
jgi:hypothetical protein